MVRLVRVSVKILRALWDVMRKRDVQPSNNFVTTGFPSQNGSSFSKLLLLVSRTPPPPQNLTAIVQQLTRSSRDGDARIMISGVCSGVTSDAISFEVPFAKVISVTFPERFQMRLDYLRTEKQGQRP